MFTQNIPALILLSLFLLLMSCDEPVKQECLSTSEGIQPFLEKLTSTFPRVRDMAISPAGDEMMFSVESIRQEMAAIIVVTGKNGCWSNPKVVSFSGRYRDIEPHYSQDGSTLYFASNRPVSDDPQRQDYNIYSVTKSNGEWGDVKMLPSTINTTGDEFYPSVTSKGHLYFTAAYEGCVGREDIFRSEWNGSDYETPVCIGPGVNTPFFEFNAFIDPNEKYLIYTTYGRDDDLGGGDLYISFSDEEGHWFPGVHMGDQINSPGLDFCPFVDVKNGVLYLTSDRSKVKDSYPSALNIEQLKKEFSGHGIGLGRLYTIPFNVDDYR
jgi:hypothetical protein